MPAPTDPRTPVIVGVGQLSQRVDRGAPVLEPVDLMVEALRRAEADAATPGLTARADSIRVNRELSWRYGDPGALVAERLGASPRQTVYTVMGGNYTQTLVNQTALDIQAGHADLVLLTGGEAWRSRSALRATDEKPDWTEQAPDATPTLMLGEDDPSLSSPVEIERKVFLPVHAYPMFENAIAARAGRTVPEQAAVAAALWAGFSEVAAANPYAWIQRSYTAEEIVTPSAENRMIGWPYTKLMNSNNNVEQAAALIMCSVQGARDLGVPESQWVFPLAGADAHDHWFMTNRADLCSSPALRLAGSQALALAGIGADDLAHVDLYSCFPSAVQIAASELGLGLDRPLTVTGGMSFAGGPWNNYPMHAIAAMVERLRSEPGAYGLCTANGGYTTKHAIGIYSTEPPAAGFRHTYPQDEVDALPTRDGAPDHVGAVTVETFTVMHDRDGRPEIALFALLTDSGARTWGSSTDADVMDDVIANGAAGRAAKVAADGEVSLA